MVTKEGSYYYTAQLTPGTLVCRDYNIFKGVTEEDYQKIKERVKQKKENHFLQCIDCATPTYDCEFKKVI